MSTLSVSEVKQRFEKLCPERTLRLRYLRLFAEAIEHAHHHAPDAWAVVVLPTSSKREIRLTVGNFVVFAVAGKRGKLWLPLDLKELKASPRSEMLLNDARSWEQDPDYPEFKRIRSQNGFYSLGADPSEKLLPILRELNFAFIKRIGKRKYKLDQRSRDAYTPTVIAFLRQALDQSIPEPQIQSISTTKIDMALPEEISKTEVFYEGARKQISVNAYERNRVARRKCLEHYGFRCAVCAHDMSETYGTVAEQLIHVHHLKPLREIKEGYQVDPIQDLRPVCPNCHAVIHRRKPPYTIEEVKGFLEAAKQTHRKLRIQELNNAE